MLAAITVLIPTHNGEAFVADAIESILGQNFQLWELVIGDDASTDGTRTVVERYLHDPRIRFFQNPVNVGMAANWNRCLALVATRYFMLLGQDDFFNSPRALEIAYGALETHPEVPAAYCDLLFVGAKRQRLLARTFRRTGLVDSVPLARRSILQTRNLFGIPLLIRYQAAEGAQYDPHLELATDVDFSIATARGRPVYHIAEFLIGYRFHGGNQTGRVLGRVAGEMRYIAAKHGIRLRPWDPVFMRMCAFATTLARQTVLRYGRTR